MDHGIEGRLVGRPEEHADELAVKPPLVHADRDVVEVVVDVGPARGTLVGDGVDLAGELAEHLAGQHRPLAAELADELAVEHAELAVLPACAGYQVARLVGVVPEHLAGERAAVSPDRVVGRQAVIVPDAVGCVVKVDAQLVVGADLCGDSGEENHGGEHGRGRPDDERRGDKRYVQAPARVHVRDQGIDGLGNAGAARPVVPSAPRHPCSAPRHPCSPSPPPPFPGLKPLPPLSLLGNISSYGSRTREQKSRPFSVTW